MLIKRDRNSVYRASRPHDRRRLLEWNFVSRIGLHPHQGRAVVCFAAQFIYVLRDNLFRLNDGGQIVARFDYVASAGNGIHADLSGKEWETIRKTKKK